MKLSLTDTVNWARRCTNSFEANNFSLFVAQVKPYAPLVITYKSVFIAAFKRLELTERLNFLRALNYLSSLAADKEAPVNIDNLDELFMLLVESTASDEALKSADYQVKSKIIMVLLKALLLLPRQAFPKTYSAFLVSFKKHVDSEKYLVVQNLLSTCEIITLRPSVYEDSMGLLLNTILSVYQPQIKWFVIEQFMFFVPKQLFLYLLQGQRMHVQLEACKLILINEGSFVRPLLFLFHKKVFYARLL